MSPVVLNAVVFEIEASTVLSISLSAVEMPTAMEKPITPAAEPARATAAASAVIRVLSTAVSVMSAASMPCCPSPSIKARMSVRPRFSTPTPAPPRAMPTVPPAAAATEPAKVMALISPSASASRVRLPAAETEESFT